MLSPVTHLHDGRKEIPLYQVCQERRLVCARSCSQDNINGFVPYVDYHPVSMAPCTSSRSAARVFPLRIMPSSVPTNSVKIVSIWSRPARTVIMSELGWGYFLERREDRKTVNVCDNQLPIIKTPKKNLHPAHSLLRHPSHSSRRPLRVQKSPLSAPPSPGHRQGTHRPNPSSAPRDPA